MTENRDIGLPADIKAIIWPEKEPVPKGTSLEESSFLRMYPPDRKPRTGSLRTDQLIVSSHWHYHDMHQLDYSLEGVIELEAEAGKYLISPQVAAWIPAGCHHRASLSRAPSGSIFFTRDLIDNPGNSVRGVLLTPLLRAMIIESARWPLLGPESQLRTDFYRTMGGLCCELIQENVELFLPTSEDARLRRALDYTIENIEVSLPEVAKAAGMSERSLRRRLKTETGLTWDNYRQRSRVLRAINLLSETDDPITTIAFNCGFESHSGLSRVFQAIMGESPRQYRSRIRGRLHA